MEVKLFKTQRLLSKRDYNYAWRVRNTYYVIIIHKKNYVYI